MKLIGREQERGRMSGRTVFVLDALIVYVLLIMLWQLVP